MNNCIVLHRKVMSSKVQKRFIVQCQELIINSTKCISARKKDCVGNSCYFFETERNVNNTESKMFQFKAGFKSGAYNNIETIDQLR